jgi:hypothetical protein
MVLGTVVFQDHFDVFSVHPSLIALQEVGKRHFPSFRRKPESSEMKFLKSFWTPATLSRRKPGAGVTTCHEIIFFS